MSRPTKLQRAKNLVLEVALDYATYIREHLDDGSWDEAPEASPEGVFLEACAALKTAQGAA